MFTSCLSPSVTVEMNEDLTKKFIKEEVQKAVFEIGSLKALGKDGLPGLFPKNIGMQWGRWLPRNV